MNSFRTLPDSLLILKPDRLYADLLLARIQEALPLARIRLAASVNSAATLLDLEPVELLVIGTLPAFDGEVLEFLACRKRAQVRRVFVIAGSREYRVLASLHDLAVDGIFDSISEPPENFAPALYRVLEGHRFISAATQESLHRAEIPSSFVRLLTRSEQLVLSVIGDGCDDHAAAQTLGLSPATISTVRRTLHRKLGIQHRGELIRIAAQHGFVRFTPSGVVRPCFSLLAAACKSRKKHPQPIPRGTVVPMPDAAEVA